MEFLKNYSDSIIFVILAMMAFVALWCVIERILFFRKLEFKDYASQENFDNAVSENLTTLYVIYSNAPYVGLLGTVIGIMITFYDMSLAGNIDVKSIVLGLSLALKATALGKMKNSEKIMLGVFILLLLLWAGAAGYLFGLEFDSTTIALLGLSLVLISGILTFGEVLGEKAAWNTLTWFSGLVMMATMLGKLGVTKFLADSLGILASNMGLGEISIMIFLSLAFLYAHYFFASTTAHISAMFFVFYSAGLALGAPPLLYAFIMLTAGNVMMAITHYATGTAPVIFGTNYVSMNRWWGVGFVLSIVDMAVMTSVGLVWWKFLGFY